jgi:hypothetical protein
MLQMAKVKYSTLSVRILFASICIRKLKVRRVCQIWNILCNKMPLQVVVGFACLAVVVVAYPVEYEDFSHFAPASVQYQHAEPLAKHLVVEKYVSSRC